MRAVLFKKYLFRGVKYWSGVNICPKYDIFAPPPISLNDIFSPRYSENLPFFHFSTPFPLIFALFHNKSSYFFPDQPMTHIWGKRENEKYTPLTLIYPSCAPACRGLNLHWLHCYRKMIQRWQHAGCGSQGDKSLFLACELLWNLWERHYLEFEM